MTLQEQLQRSLGGTYRIERELGGGGMSRVFVARDESLRRNVVVKVLPPDLVAGVNAERFNREIELAAGLQHPHIVQVLTAGQMDGVPYYTMPFVDGESLRARLSRGGALPMTEVIGVLRDVSKALAYAHGRGIVHRDIKPDNVLLSGGSATVADFGIAKAISAARTAAPGGTLTQIGTSIGTPAYMAPEQAAADPATDHRADLYSFGCVAYEVLTGRPPFVASSPQRLLAAHMGEVPQPVAELRPDTPAVLADLVMRCLAKDANARPQQASDIVRVLETVTSGSGHEAMPSALLGGRGMLRKALAIYAVAFVIVAVVAKAAIVGIGLPDWVFPGALIVMALGLPVILFTAYVNATTRRAYTATPTYTPGGTPSMAGGTMATIALKASPHVSWRRTALGGAWALGGFVLLIGAYMVLRAFGIGPAGSLLASGAFDKDERIIVADFPSPANDSALGPVVTDAFRTALGQSQSIVVLQQTTMRDVLLRMQKPANVPVDFALAREIASREGVKAVIDGKLIGVGGKYAISLRMLSAQSGEELASFRETANDQSEILPTIDKLAKEVRAKIGESLKKVQTTPALEQVTTPSLDALKKYVQGSRAIAMDGDWSRGVALLEEAITVDTAFAMAFRRLAVEYNNRGMGEKAGVLLEKAFLHRDRLSDAERYLVTGSYYQNGIHQDLSKARIAYEQLLEIQPKSTPALNNLANIYRYHQDEAKAAELYARAIKVGPPSAVFFMNLARSQSALGQHDSAVATLDAFAQTFPTNPYVAEMKSELYWTRKMFDSSEAIATRGRATSSDPSVTEDLVYYLASAARLRGRIADSRRLTREAYAIGASRHEDGAELMGAIEDAAASSWFLNDTTRAIRSLDSVATARQLDSLPPSVDFPLRLLTFSYARARRGDKARLAMARWEKTRQVVKNSRDSLARHAMQGEIALAEGRYPEATHEFRAALSAGDCWTCWLPRLASAYDLAGNADSAIAVFERYIDFPGMGKNIDDGLYLAGSHKRLGELYEAKGDRQRAARHYTTFVELWKKADPELQPQVNEVRKRLARLSDVEKK
jgi:tetratricopeptide (TPR) repeat protein